MIDEEHLSICHKCVGDEFLKIGIRSEGKRGKCSYCEKSRKVVPLPWLADNIHAAIEEHFYLTSNEPTPLEYALLKDKESNYDWERHGQEVNYLIQDIAEVTDNVSNDVQTYLSFYFGGDPKEFEENTYGDEACYEEKSPESYSLQESWDFFCQEIRYRARFFSESTEEVLGALFSDLNELKTYNGTPVILNAGIFRSRVCLSHETLDHILKNPIKELGAPPSKLSKQGRMNAEGISVFYGAADAETCIAEVRPPVGSHVVVGRFQITRNIKLLNLDLLSQVYAKGSYFDPEFGSRKGHASFLNHLVREFVKPVMPGKEMFEYLPTQVVAEYLAEKVEPNLDGIIFKSSQYNITPGTKVSVDYGWVSDDDSDDSITIFEELRDDNKDDVQEETLDNFYNFEDDFINNRETTLNLDVLNSIDVRVITGASYNTHQRYVTRYKREKVHNSDESFF